jgi:hypothetical protein
LHEIDGLAYRILDAFKGIAGLGLEWLEVVSHPRSSTSAKASTKVLTKP